MKQRRESTHNTVAIASTRAPADLVLGAVGFRVLIVGLLAVAPASGAATASAGGGAGAEDGARVEAAPRDTAYPGVGVRPGGAQGGGG